MFNTHFRAKSNGIWVYGDYYNNCDRGVNQSFIVSDNEKTGTGEHYLIDSSTLCICTGVKDVTGNYIYEGDFLVDTVDDGFEKYYGYYPVVYNEKDASFCIDNSYYKDHTSLVNMVSYFGLEMLVDGNIFDNEERLPQQNISTIIPNEPIDDLPF